MFRWRRKPMSDSLSGSNEGTWKLLPNCDLKWNLYIYSTKRKKYVTVKEGLKNVRDGEKIIKHLEHGELYSDGSL